jgi:hypothetical protein
VNAPDLVADEVADLTDRAGRRYRAAVATVPDNGRVIYRIAGPNFAGALTLEPDDSESTEEWRRLHVRYGAYTYDRYPSDYRRAEEAPQVYGVELTGGCYVSDAAALDLSKRHHLPARRWLGPGQSETAPPGARARTEDVVLMVARHWLTRPDRSMLRWLWLRYLAPARLAEKQHILGNLRTQMGKLHGELAEYERAAAALQRLLAEEEPPCL